MLKIIRWVKQYKDKRKEKDDNSQFNKGKRYQKQIDDIDMKEQREMYERQIAALIIRHRDEIKKIIKENEFYKKRIRKHQKRIKNAEIKISNAKLAISKMKQSNNIKRLNLEAKFKDNDMLLDRADWALNKLEKEMPKLNNEASESVAGLK